MGQSAKLVEHPNNPVVVYINPSRRCEEWWLNSSEIPVRNSGGLSYYRSTKSREG
jgi:hypothetical protein